jgi:hypothetical protein
MSVTQTEFEFTLGEIAMLKRQLAPLESDVKTLTDQIEMLKVEAMAYMQSTRSKRTEPVNGFYLTRVAGRTTKRVTDEDAALDWLSLQEDEDITEYMKLDQKAVIHTAEEHLKATGEILPFIEVVQGQEYLTVKEETK